MMFYNIKSTIFLLFFCCCHVKRSTSEILEFRVHELDVLDGYLQIELLDIITPRVDTVVSQYNTLVDNCVRMITDEADKCVECGKTANCGNGNPDAGQIALAIIESLQKRPWILMHGVTGLLDHASAQALLNTNKALNKLRNAAHTVIKTIEKGLKEPVKTVKKVVKKIRRIFRRIWGKRSTRTSRSIDQCFLDKCESCRRVDMETRGNETIINDICKENIKKQKNAENEIERYRNQVKYISEKKTNIVNKLSFRYNKAQARSGNWNFPVTELKVDIGGKSMVLHPTAAVHIRNIGLAAKTLAPIIYDMW